MDKGLNMFSFHLQSHTSIRTVTTPLPLHSVSTTPYKSLSNTVLPKPSPSNDGDSSQSSLVVVGISTGVAVAISLLAALLVIVVCVLRQKKHKRIVDLQQHSSYLSSRRDSPVYYSGRQPSTTESELCKFHNNIIVYVSVEVLPLVDRCGGVL